MRYLILYDYDESGFLVCSSPAQICEITGDPIYRINSTDKEPPTVMLPKRAIYDGEQWLVFTPTETPEITIEQLRKSMSLTAAQSRIRLAKEGLLIDIISRINAMPDDAHIKIMWEYETVFKRLDPVLCDFCKQSLGLTDERIDNLFTGNVE
jgi:hypothetical protein